MSVLVETSVWVEQFRHRNTVLAELLVQDAVLTHPFVLTELACGTPPDRQRTLSDLSLLRQVQQASQTEIRDFIEREQLYGQGCGLVDLSLLASALITPDTSLWTLDKRLAGLAQRFAVDYRPLN